MTTDPKIGILSERRLKPRFTCNYPALIQGHDEKGTLFHAEGRALNLSRNGVKIVLRQQVPFGMELTIKLAFNTTTLKEGTSSLVFQGKVVRCEVHSDSVYNVAIHFQDYRFI
jgi:hypothetical protein